MIYDSRQAAGVRLALALQRFTDPDVVVLALPRGGVVLGYEVAKHLRAPLGLIVVRKIGHLLSEEYAIGAVAEGEQAIYNLSELVGIDAKVLQSVEAAARDTIKLRKELYFTPGIKRPRITGKTVLIVDDGIATGLTMQAAISAARAKIPKRIVIAVPIASRDSVTHLEPLVDEMVVLDDPDSFLGAVGDHYREFDPVYDDEVNKYLREAQRDTSVYAAELATLQHEEGENPKEIPRNPQS